MLVDGHRFATGKFQDVPWMMTSAAAMYERIVAKHGKNRSCIPLTAQRIIRERKWDASFPLTSTNFARVLDELRIFYVPKNNIPDMLPGPCVVFPQRDIFGNYTRARIKPQYELNLKHGAVKYAQLGTKREWKGPEWFGNSLKNTERLLSLKYVVLVEGPFDLLACKLVCPDLPVMSTGTKTINAKHLDYLEMLSVKQIVLMFDQDEAKPGKLGAGQAAMQTFASRIRVSGRFRVVTAECPAKDPAACLQEYRLARTLAMRLSAFAGGA